MPSAVFSLYIFWHILIFARVGTGRVGEIMSILHGVMFVSLQSLSAALRTALFAYLILPLEKQPLQHKGAYLDGVDGFEDEFNRQPVGDVTHDGSPRRQRPRLVVQKPDEHLNHSQQKPEEKPAGFVLGEHGRECGREG